MTQRFVSSTEAGGLRFISRADFARTSYPQASCAGCRYRADCADLLATPAAHESWMVRDPYLASSDDMTVIEQCARSFGTANIPPDVKVLRRRMAPELATFLGQLGEPAKRPRERRRRRGSALSTPPPALDYDLDDPEPADGLYTPQEA